MNAPRPRQRYRAISMELAACLDEHTVEMRILTDEGDIISVACPRSSIFAVQRHIEQIGRECPEIATWSGSAQGEFTELARTPAPLPGTLSPTA